MTRRETITRWSARCVAAVSLLVGLVSLGYIYLVYSDKRVGESARMVVEHVRISDCDTAKAKELACPLVAPLDDCVNAGDPLHGVVLNPVDIVLGNSSRETMLRVATRAIAAINRERTRWRGELAIVCDQMIEVASNCTKKNAAFRDRCAAARDYAQRPVAYYTWNATLHERHHGPFSAVAELFAGASKGELVPALSVLVYSIVMFASCGWVLADYWHAREQAQKLKRL